MPKRLYTTQKDDDFGVKKLYKGSIYDSSLYSDDFRQDSALYNNEEKGITELYKDEGNFSKK